MSRRRASEEWRREQIRAAAFEVAAREGLGGLTVRLVAAEANVSHALVLFHFGRKDRLLQELLEWLLSSTYALQVSEEIARLPRAVDRLNALLEQEMVRLGREPRRSRLFVEYWAMGARKEPFRARISAELERYRATLRGIMQEALAATAPLAGVTAEALAAVAVSWIYGGVVQRMNDPDNFDTAAYVAAVRSIVAHLAGETSGGADTDREAELPAAT